MRHSLLSYKDMLYKSVLAVLVCIAFILPAGCGEFYSNDGMTLQQENNMLLQERHQINRERNLLTQENSALVKKYESLNMRLTVFTMGLSDEELQAYEKFISSAQSNLATYELNKRALDKVLTENNAQILAALRQGYADLELERNALTQKIQIYNQRLERYNQNLLAYQQAIIENQRARRAAAQAVGQGLMTFSQSYQQQLNASYNNPLPPPVLLSPSYQERRARQEYFQNLQP